MRTEIRKDDPYIGAGVALAVVLFVLYVYPGFLIPVSPHFDGSCKTIPLDQYAEDLRIDPSNGLAYLTYSAGDIGSIGTVMLVDLNAAEPHVRAALSSDPERFAPSGLSLYTPASGPKRLFVTSRTQLGKHSVEIFDQSPTGAFTPVETFRDSLLWSPTAIVAVGPRQFYVVNQLGFRNAYNGGKGDVGDRLRGNQSTVVYYDGEQMKIVAGRLSLASGIAMSPDGSTVYVAESAAGRITIFERDPASGALKQKEQIRVPGAPHNLNVAADGTLWVSAHPHAIPFMEVLGNTSEHAPTQVLKVTPGAAPDKQVEEVYVDDGNELSAGTVAALRSSGQFIAASRTDRKLLTCTWSGATKPVPADET
ncbi:MAG: SMP-30/gluconolactonase/LRE family protein [Gammaproteobacteria bacterium]